MNAPVVRSVRRHALLGSGFFHQVIALVHPDIKLHLVDFRGGIADDRLLMRAFPRAPSRRRSVMTLVLEGIAWALESEHGHWLAPGDVLSVPNREELVMRLDGRHGYSAVVVEWDGGGAERRGVGHASAVEMAEARRLADELVAGKEQPEALLQRAAALFGVRLAPLIRIDGLAPWAGVSRALDGALSTLASSAGLADIAEELDVSERHARRLIEQMQRTYGLNTSGTWLDALLRRRVMMAALALTSPGIRVAEVARSVGYGSASSLCRAFESLGLPSPGRVRAECDALA